MNKQEFISALKGKLTILHTEEIEDILTEYGGYIDNKLAEGKPEEEAVKDFGNINDLADEILDAYKINKEYSKEYTKKKQTSSGVDDFIDAVSDILNQVMDYTVKFFSNIFHDYSVENIVQLLVMIFVAMIIIAVMKLPFAILEGLGRWFIHVILDYQIARLFVIVWSVIVNLFYFIIAFLIIAGLINGVREKKDIGVSINEVFSHSFRYSHRNKKGKYTNNTYSKRYRSQKETIIVEAESPIHPSDSVSEDIMQDPQSNTLGSEKASSEDNDNLFEKEKNRTQGFRREQRNDRDTTETRQSNRAVRSLLEVLLAIFKFFVLVVLLPVYAGMIGVGIAIGVVVYLLFQGISIFGVLLLLIGVLALISTLTNLVWYILDSRKSYRIYGFKASMITSCIILGFGSVFSFFDLMKFEYTSFPAISYAEEQKKSLTYDITGNTMTFQFETSQISLVQDASLNDGRVKIEVLFDGLSSSVSEYESSDQTKYIHVYTNQTNFNQGKKMILKFIDGLKDNKLYQFDNFNNHRIVVYANQQDMTYLTHNMYSVVYQK